MRISIELPVISFESESKIEVMYGAMFSNIKGINNSVTIVRGKAYFDTQNFFLIMKSTKIRKKEKIEDLVFIKVVATIIRPVMMV